MVAYYIYFFVNLTYSSAICQFREESRRERETAEILKEVSTLRTEKAALQQQLISVTMETKGLREDLLSMCAKSGLADHTQSSVLTKAQVINLELQLTAARAARNDALREVKQLTEKFDAASKALYEVLFRIVILMINVGCHNGWITLSELNHLLILSVDNVGLPFFT